MHLSLNDPPGVAYCRIFRKDNTSVQSEGMPVFPYFAADEAGALQGRDEKVATKPQGINSSKGKYLEALRFFADLCFVSCHALHLTIELLAS
jgi:hypothetical protein